MSFAATGLVKHKYHRHSCIRTLLPSKTAMDGNYGTTNFPQEVVVFFIMLLCLPITRHLKASTLPNITHVKATDSEVRTRTKGQYRSQTPTADPILMQISKPLVKSHTIPRCIQLAIRIPIKSENISLSYNDSLHTRGFTDHARDITNRILQFIAVANDSISIAMMIMHVQISLRDTCDAWWRKSRREKLHSYAWQSMRLAISLHGIPSPHSRRVLKHSAFW